MNLNDWLDERTGWKTLKKTLLDRNIPKINWWYTLGSITAFLFIMQGVTGIFLAMNYSASPDHAYDSVNYITREVPAGAFLRGLHAWGASAMVASVLLHMLRVFFMGSYKYPREVIWWTGVVLLLITFGFSFTGYLLPWDQKAYWATVVGTNISTQAPLIGEFIGKIIKGGSDMGTVTLARFFAIHVLVLPAIALAFLLFHFFLVVWHGISAPPERKKEANDEWRR